MRLIYARYNPQCNSIDAFVIIEFTGLDTPGSVYERVAGAGLGVDCGMLIVLAMYLSGLLGKIKARREMKRKYNCK